MMHAILEVEQSAPFTKRGAFHQDIVYALLIIRILEQESRILQSESRFLSWIRSAPVLISEVSMRWIRSTYDTP